MQTCIVHLIRKSSVFVSWKERKAILLSVKVIDRAENTDMALVRLEEFEAEVGQTVSGDWPGLARRSWERFVPFFAFAPAFTK